jgi:hypothetical protein
MKRIDPVRLQSSLLQLHVSVYLNWTVTVSDSIDKHKVSFIGRALCFGNLVPRGRHRISNRDRNRTWSSRRLCFHRRITIVGHQHVLLV